MGATSKYPKEILEYEGADSMGARERVKQPFATSLSIVSEMVRPGLPWLVPYCYLKVTVRVASPPKLLRTVMLCGLTGHVNSPRNLPPPSFESVPIS